MANLTHNNFLEKRNDDRLPFLEAFLPTPSGEFDQQAKLWMRLKFMEQVANGTDDPGLARFRRIVSEDRGWNKTQVAATCAHVWIKADKTLKAFGLSELISRKDFVALAFQILSAQENIACTLQSPGEFPVGKRQTVLTAITEYAVSLFGPRCRFNVQTLTSPSSRTAKPTKGSQVDYDNPTKQAWGYTELDFIARNTTPEWLARSTILVLPGKECHELDRLLKLPGVKPKNIIAVEGDNSVHEEFERNARARGVTPYPAQLEKLLPSLQSRLGVVMLDFHGNTCQKNLSILEQLPLADRALVLINVMIGRESGAAQKLLAGVYDNAFNNRLGDQVAAWRSAELGSNGDIKTAIEVFESVMNERDTEIHFPTLTDIRNDVLDNIFLGRIESARRRPSRFVTKKGRGYFSNSGEVINNQEYLMFRGMLFDMTRMLSGVLQKIVNYSSLKTAPDVTVNLTRWVDNVVFTNPLIRRLEKFRYQSETGSKKQFYSSFAVVEKPRVMYKQSIRSVQFILRCVKAMQKEHQRAGISTKQKFLLELVDLNGKPPGNISDRHNILCFKVYNKVSATQTLGTFLDDWLGYTNKEKRLFAHDVPTVQTQIERKKITADDLSRLRGSY